MTNARYPIADHQDIETLGIYRKRRALGYAEEKIMDSIHAKSRDNARTPMQWSGEENAGFTTGTPWLAPPENYRRINAKAQMRDETSIRAFYKKLVALRKALPVISEGKIEFILRDNPQVLAYRRDTENAHMLVLCNLTGENAEVTLPKGWKKATVIENTHAPKGFFMCTGDCHTCSHCYKHETTSVAFKKH